MIEKDTTWHGNNGEEFLVLHVVELDGHRWVHYRDVKGKEYSCYEEAFELRFRQHVNSNRKHGPFSSLVD